MMLFHCPHCGGPLTLEMLEADERYRAALPLLAGLADLASLALRYAEKWAPPRKALQARKLVSILEELDRLVRAKELKKGRAAEAFERIDLKRALEVCAERAFDPPLNGHAFLYSVIVNKRESRLQYEEKKRDRELQAARPQGTPEPAPIDPSTLAPWLRGTAERKAPSNEPPGEKSE